MRIGDQNNPSKMDPILISPKGFEVQVPAASVQELLGKGYKLKNENWFEEQKARKGPPPNPFAPHSRHRIEEELSEELDSLEVTAI